MNTSATVQKVFSALNQGQELTSKQISARFDVSNPHDMIYRIRNSGYAVNLIESVDTSGRKKFKYSMLNLKPSVTSYTVKGTM